MTRNEEDLYLVMKNYHNHTSKYFYNQVSKKMTKKILVSGATGAMGKYLVPLLSACGYSVDAVSLDKTDNELPNVRNITGNAMDWDFLGELLKNRYDAIVDFMIYGTTDLARFLPYLQQATDHYIYLSSYRVYDNKEIPIRESSPRLLDSSENIALRNSEDYSIYKARGENIIRAFPKKNWTIIRPAITYSLMRYQLVTLEAPNTVGRAFAGKSVLLPEQARNIQGTMSWAGDVATMISRLLFNEKAFGETFSVCTADHHSWGEIADYSKEICGLDAIWIDKEDYIPILDPEPHNYWSRWQLEYDRMFDRIMDNSKILKVTGMSQKDLMPLYQGLEREISRCPRDYCWPVNQLMDDYIAKMIR